MMRIDAEFPEKLQILFKPARYKVLRGGRGSGKSWGIARALLIMGMQRPLRVLCAREVQISIKHSVHRLLSDQIKLLGLSAFYSVQLDSIRGVNGTEFAFTGLSTLTADTIKSYEGYDICWVEEGQVISKRSWDILLPTIRKENSEIWISYNPDLETDETHQRFTVQRPDNCVNIEMNWRDNPWFNEVLEAERQYCLKYRPLDYENIWEGKPRGSVEGAYYSQQIAQAEADGRITNVPVDSLPVHTAWDLGYGDATAIWFFQLVGLEVHFVDYYEASGEDLEHYARVLQDRKYLYGDHFAPHDARARRLSAPSIEDRARELGIDFIVLERDSNILAGIEVVRSMFHRFWFDKERCFQGIRALRSYRKEWNERRQCFNSRPLHDWASHGADALRYAARAIKEFSPGHSIGPDQIEAMYEAYAPPVEYR